MTSGELIPCGSNVHPNGRVRRAAAARMGGARAHVCLAAATADRPWSRQVAVGVMRTLGGWRRQEAVAASSGSSRNYQRSLARRLRLLAALLGP